MKNKKIIKIIMIILVVIILAVVVFICVDMYNNRKIIATSDEISDYLDINLSNIEAENIDYFIEKKDIAGATYIKGEVQYTLKSSSNPKRDLVDTNHKWGANILMYCDVEENEQVQVISCLDEDNLSIMKSEWYDNGLYYSMYTENLTNREEFLLEVNKVVLDNHIKKDE